jgi:DNA-binding NarL/FixJ family response regulator
MAANYRVMVIGGVGESQQKLSSVFREIREAELIAVVDSGEEGVNRYSQLKPDVIIVDMITDGISGIETARWIKEQTPSIKIIILSSQFNKEFLHAIVTMGVDGYLIKDVNATLIREALKSLSAGSNYFVNKPKIG